MNNAMSPTPEFITVKSSDYSVLCKDLTALRATNAEYEKLLQLVVSTWDPSGANYFGRMSDVVDKIKAAIERAGE